MCFDIGELVKLGGHSITLGHREHPTRPDTAGMSADGRGESAGIRAAAGLFSGH